MSVALLVWGTLCFLVDPLLKMVFTQGLGLAVRAPVGVELFRSNWVQTGLQLERLEIADRDRPGRNALEIAEIQIKLNRPALLQKKFIVDRARISGINWDTESSLGEISAGEGESADWAGPLLAQTRQIGAYATAAGQRVFEQILATGLAQFDPDQLETVRLAHQKEEQWQQRFERYRQKAIAYEDQAKLLKKEVDLVKQGNPLDQLQRISQIAQQADRMLSEGKQLKSEVASLTGVVRTDLTELDAARLRDTQRIRSQLAAFPLTADEWTVALVGEETVRQFEQLTGWIGFVRKCMAAAGQDLEAERGAGRFIPFARSSSLPDVLVRRFTIDGQARLAGSSIPFAGTIVDLTPTPRQYGKPCRFELKLQHNGLVRLQGVYDVTVQEPFLQVACHVESDEFPLQRLAVIDDRACSLRTSRVTGHLQMKLTGDHLDAVLNWQQHGVTLIAEKHGGSDSAAAIADSDSVTSTGVAVRPISLQQSMATASNGQFTPGHVDQTSDSGSLPLQLLTRGFAGLNTIDATVTINGPLAQPRIQVQSDVGQVLLAGVKTELARQWDRHQAASLVLAQQHMDEALAQLTNHIQRDYSGVLGEIQLGEKLAQELKDSLNVRSAAGGKLEDSVNGVLNRLLR